MVARVLTYNIHHGEGTDGRIDLPRIAEVIRRAEPDIVALQECDRLTGRSGQVDQPAELARLTGMRVVSGRNIDFDGGEYGNAVLSRWEIVEHKNHLLPRLEEHEQRGVLAVLLRAPDRQTTICLLATHLDHGRDDAERLACCERLAEMAMDRPELATLLAGDLNDEPDSTVAARLKQTWTFPASDPAPTIPSSDPRRQIDYVLYRPAAAWRVVERRVLDAAAASDHLPLLLVLETGPTEARSVLK